MLTEKKVYLTHTMPEAASVSLPTAGTVPHTDDDDDKDDDADDDSL